MKKFLLHIVSLIICLSFAFQIGGAQVASLNGEVEVEDVTDSRTVEDSIFFRDYKTSIETVFSMDMQKLIVSNYSVIDKYESSFCISSYYKLYKFHNTYLL